MTAANPTTKLAAKSLETIERLNTTHDQWGIMNSYETKIEIRNMNIKKCCPDCGGQKYIYTSPIEKDGRRIKASKLFRELLASGEIEIPADVLEYQEREGALRSYADYSFPDGEDCWGSYTPVTQYKKTWCGISSNGMTGDQSENGYEAHGWTAVPKSNMSSPKCLTCLSSRPTRHWGYQPTGFVWVWEDVECNVLYPRWPHGTGFDSRFHGHDCEICGKNGIKTGSIPVIAVRDDGSVEGMYVGNACITKMGHKKIKTVAQQLESAGSLEYGGTERKMGGDWRPTFYVRSYGTYDAEAVVVEDEA